MASLYWLNLLEQLSIDAAYISRVELAVNCMCIVKTEVMFPESNFVVLYLKKKNRLNSINSLRLRLIANVIIVSSANCDIVK